MKRTHKVTLREARKARESYNRDIPQALRRKLLQRKATLTEHLAAQR